MNGYFGEQYIKFGFKSAEHISEKGNALDLGPCIVERFISYLFSFGSLFYPNLDRSKFSYLTEVLQKSQIGSKTMAASFC